MNTQEYKATVSLAGIVALRMIGLLMILPIFALYAQQLNGATPLLVGFAMGVYGLTQAVLQIPFGLLSDRLGRKPIILVGLIFFIVGSIVAALSDSIVMMMLGRALQGAGAVGGALVALLSDLTREEQRTKAMAIVGMTIGAAFSIALVLGPMLNTWLSVSAIFWLSAGLGLAAIFILYTQVPDSDSLQLSLPNTNLLAALLSIFRNTELLRLNIGSLILHAILVSMFIALPLTLVNHLGFEKHQQWWLYLPALLLSFVIAWPFIVLSSKKEYLKMIFLGSILGLLLAQVGLNFQHDSVLKIFISLVIFFVSFNLLEANIPSWLTRIAPVQHKGTAVGVYASGQFLGIFVGGTAGGWMLTHFQSAGVFVLGIILTVIWFTIASRMDPQKQDY